MTAWSENNRVYVQCDTCGIDAPPAAEIMAAHGLNRLGWTCSGGTHFCPQCSKTHDNPPRDQADPVARRPLPRGENT